MSRIVSTRLPTVHSATSAPAQSNQPLRAEMTSRATGSITLPTTGGSANSTALMLAARSLSSPTSENSAAPRMKKGKIEKIAR